MSIDFIETVIDMIYPRRCPICGEIAMPKGEKACPVCREHLQIVREPKCKRCGKPIEQEEIEYCFDCSRKKHHFQKGYALWVYDKYMRQSMAGFKYAGRQEYAKFYGEEFVKQYGEEILALKPDAFIPVPIHKSKKKVRGYNQADILAKELGKRLGIPVISDTLLRNKKTLPQKELNDKERLKNLKEAFGIREKHLPILEKVKRVVLVDDIYTSGSTIEVCSEILWKVGVEEIYFAVLCIGKGFSE